MVDCPHAAPVNGLVSCSLLEPLQPGTLLSETSCRKCQRQWTNGTPVEPTPFLVSLVAEKEGRKASIVQKAGNWLKAMAKWTIAGRPIVPERVLQERLAVCQSCPSLDQASRSCKLCGCPVGRKSPMATEACPEGRWAEYEGCDVTTGKAGPRCGGCR